MRSYTIGIGWINDTLIYLNVQLQPHGFETVSLMMAKFLQAKSIKYFSSKTMSKYRQGQQEIVYPFQRAQVYFYWFKWVNISTKNN